MWKPIACAMALAVLGAAVPADADTARGIVFDDRNGNGVFDNGDRGLKEVLVSNGEAVVATGKKGEYEIAVGEDTGIFVIKPEGWAVPTTSRTNLPQHYYLHKPRGSPKLKHKAVEPTGPLPASVDFPLTKTDEPKEFEVLCFGDTQSRDQREVDYMAHDIIEEVVGMKAAFGTTLGDLVFNDLGVLDAYVESVGVIGLPWHHVIGNHDINFDAKIPGHADETYERFFGPSYYAYNVGEVTFFSLNNVWWDPAEGKYHGEFGETQRNFIANVLEHTDKDRLVVLFMHIPLHDVTDLKEFFALFEGFPNVFSMSAHWHRQDYFRYGIEDGWPGETPHRHLVNVTACGSWWSGAYDPVGIPHTTMADGAPNGYTILSFDGNEYSVRFKAARRPGDYQMNIHAPESATASETVNVYANVFLGSKESKVEIQLGESGAWQTMSHVTDEKDPYYVALWERRRGLFEKIASESGSTLEDEGTAKRLDNEYRAYLGRGMPKPKESGHLWKAALPLNVAPGYHVINVRTVDMFGQPAADRRVIRVE